MASLVSSWSSGSGTRATEWRRQSGGMQAKAPGALGDALRAQQGPLDGIGIYPKP